MARLAILLVTMLLLVFSSACRLDDNRIRGSIVGGSTGFDLTFRTYSHVSLAKAEFSVPSNQQTNLSHYECQVDGGTWFACTSPVDLTDAQYGLAIGDEVNFSLRTIARNGTTSSVATKRARRGKVGRGVNGTVSGVLPIPNGQFLVHGRFTSYRPYPTKSLVKVDRTGAIIKSFSAINDGPNDEVNELIQERDTAGDLTGKYLIVGAFTEYDGADVPNGIIRLNSDMSYDTTFNTGGTGSNNDVLTAVQELNASGIPTGKILIGGQFTFYNGTAYGRIIRLNSNGTVDTSFNNSGSGFDDIVEVVVQEYNTSNNPTGNYFVGGRFTTYNGAGSPDRIARLTSAGALDGAFGDATVTGGFNSNVYTIRQELDTAGDYTTSLFVGGSFNQYDGVGVPRGLVRLTGVGVHDSTFNNGGAGTGSASNWIRKIEFERNTGTGLPTGKLLVAGEFASYNGTTMHELFRANSDGTFDTTFNNGGYGARSYGLRDIQYDRNTDGSYNDAIYLVGHCTVVYNYTDTPGSFLRVQVSDGTLDSSFMAGEEAFDGCGTAKRIIPELDNAGNPTTNYFMVGPFLSYGGEDIPDGVLLFNADGSRDQNFLAGQVGPENYTDASGPAVSLSEAILDGGYDHWTGKIIIGGRIGYYNTNPVEDSVRVDLTGAVDTTYTPGFAGNFYDIEVEYDSGTQLPTGKYLLAGYFTSLDGNSAAPDHLARINSDGSWDSSFNNAGAGFNGGGASEIVLERDTSGDYTGNLLVLGGVGDYNANASVPAGLIRITSTGLHDSSFNNGGAGFVSGTAEQLSHELDPATGLPTGKLLMAGTVSTYNGAGVRRGYFRLNSDGTVDGTFAPGGANIFDTVFSFLPIFSGSSFTGKNLLLGDIHTADSTTVPKGLVLMDSSGLMDSSFNPGGDALENDGYANDPALRSGAQYRNSSGALEDRFIIGCEQMIGMYNGETRNCLFQIDSNGTLDPYFEGDWR